MENYSDLKINKITKKSKKSKTNEILKEYKKSLSKEKPIKTFKKNIKIVSKKNKKKNKNPLFDIPTNLNFQNVVSPINEIVEDIKPVMKKSLYKVNKKTKPILDDTKNMLSQKITENIPENKVDDKLVSKKSTKKKRKYKQKTISINMKKNKKKDIDSLLKKLDEMKLDQIQKKLKSKGINSKIKNKNKLLKYMYLLTCVDDNINVIKD
jgi:hypothetical protein